MSSISGRIRGFKNERRRLLEDTKNLIVFGTQQQTPEFTRTNGRLMRRTGGGNASPSSAAFHSIMRPPTNVTNNYRAVKTPRGSSIVREPDRNVRRFLENNRLAPNDFANTKPWRTRIKEVDTVKSVETPQTIKKSKVPERSSPKKAPAPSPSKADASTLPTKRLQAKIAEIVSAVGPPPKNAEANNYNSSKVEIDPVLLNIPPAEVEKMEIRSKVVNAIHCPICLSGLEKYPHSRKVTAAESMKLSGDAHEKAKSRSGSIRKAMEIGWGVHGKSKRILDGEDVIVAANCGELFHKVCLREWCARSHGSGSATAPALISSRSPRVSPRTTCHCPSCGKELRYSHCQEIDVVKAFTSDQSEREKDYVREKQISKELQIMWPESITYLTNLKRDVEDKRTFYNEIKLRRKGVKAELRKLTADELSVVMSKVTNVMELKTTLEKQEKAMEFMQQETLQTLRIYLLTVMRKLKETSSSTTAKDDAAKTSEMVKKIPDSLMPYLPDILKDDEALQFLAKIIAPKINDPEELKLMELQILHRYDPSVLLPVPRTATYTRFSNDNLAEETPLVISKTQADPTIDVETVPEQCSLKLAPAEHVMPVITTISSNILPLLQAPPGFSTSESEVRVQKPTQLFKVLEIAESELRINSSADLSAMESISRKVSDNMSSDSLDSRQQFRPLPPSAKQGSSMEVSGGSTMSNIEGGQPQTTQTVATITSDRGLEKSRSGSKTVLKTGESFTVMSEPETIQKEPPEVVELEPQENDDSWSTVLSSDEDEKEPSSKAGKTKSRKKGHESDDSCRMVFSAAESRKSKSESDAKLDQLSITIMYVIDSDDEREAKVAARNSQDRALEERALSPVHLRAQKTSTYSIVAADISNKSLVLASSVEGQYKLNESSETEATGNSLSSSSSNGLVLTEEELQKNKQVCAMGSLPLPLPVPTSSYQNRDNAKDSVHEQLDVRNKSAFDSLPILNLVGSGSGGKINPNESEKNNYSKEKVSSKVSVFFENEVVKAKSAPSHELRDATKN